jgi:AcrR family transcriptional regulator
MNDTPGKRGRGRPPSMEARDKAIAAARDILMEAGLDKLSIESVARRSGTGKPTLYRHWANALELAMEVLMQEVDPALPPDIEASPRAAIMRQLDRLVEILNAPLGGAVVKAMALSGPQSEIAERFREHFLLKSRRATHTLLTRFIQSGDLAAPEDIEVFLDMLYGPLFLRVLAGHERLDKSLPGALVETAFAALAPGSRTEGHR